MSIERKQPTLRIFPGAWGLPSLTASGNALVAYIRASGNENHITVCSMPCSCYQNPRPQFVSPRGSRTQFDGVEDEVEQCCGCSYQSIIEELRLMQCNLEYGLTDEQQADVFAYTLMIEQTLQPALVYSSAMSCFSALDEKLGDNLYLFGNRPTMADCIALGYISIFLNAPVANATLVLSIEHCHRLVQWCRRLQTKYFDQEQRQFRLELKQRNEDQQKAHSHRWQIASAVGGAVIIMGLYSLIMKRIPEHVVFVLPQM